MNKLIKIAASVPLYYCVQPPDPCPVLVPLYTLTINPEAASPHWLDVTVNGNDLGRAAQITYDVPNSHFTPDRIFKDGFQ